MKQKIERNKSRIYIYKYELVLPYISIYGERTCSVCGSPIVSPMGSDVLYEDGSTAHSPVLAMNSSCINPSCEKYRKWGESNGNIT